MWLDLHFLLCVTIQFALSFMVATAPSVLISASLTARNALDRMQGHYAGCNKGA
jgi:hypothetical protein